MNNLMPINLNLNLKKDYTGKLSNKDNTSDKLDFRKKLESHSKKNDNKDINNKKNEKRDTRKNVENQNVDNQNKEEVNAQNKNIRKQDKQINKQESKENTNIGESKEVNTEENIGKDIVVDEEITKEDLENIMSILQSINVEDSNKQQIENIQNNIGELIEKIESGEINIDDLKSVFIKLEDADFISKEDKTEILNKLELMINQKDTNSNYIEIDDENIDKNIIENKGVKESSKVETIKEDQTKQENTQNKVSGLNKTNENLQQSTSYNQNEDLDKINENFLIKDAQNEEVQENFNFQNINIAKITNGIKGSTGTLLNNKVNNIDAYNIIDQITKKSNIITNGTSSSIEMQLEPEHLGTLTLKIVLERGILSAKFIAENDEVKATIEENMEELKNNLSEQGINIQSLSVSVDSQGDLNKHKNILEAMAYNKKISKNIDIETDEPSNEIENPYLFEDDNFNGLA